MLPGMSLPEIQRKVRQHDNDVAAIYEIVSGHSEDLAQLKEDLTEVRGDLTEVRGNLSEVREDLTGVKATLAEHGSKLDELLALLRDGLGRSTPGA
jgi:chromosome segregation ATPase